MSESLVLKAENIVLERWFKEFLSLEQVKELIRQDSWTLSEAVCFVFYKKPWPELEDPSLHAMFHHRSKCLAQILWGDSEDEAVHAKVYWIPELVKRICNYYVKAKKAIEGGVLKASPNGYVKPNAFIKWAKKVGIYPLDKRGRKKDTDAEEQIQKIGEISGRPENINVITIRKLFQHVDAQKPLEELLKGLPKKVHEHEIEKIKRKVRSHSSFQGKICGTGPKRKK